MSMSDSVGQMMIGESFFVFHMYFYCTAFILSWYYFSQFKAIGEPVNLGTWFNVKQGIYLDLWKAFCLDIDPVIDSIELDLNTHAFEAELSSMILEFGLHFWTFTNIWLCFLVSYGLASDPKVWANDDFIYV